VGAQAHQDIAHVVVVGEHRAAVAVATERLGGKKLVAAASASVPTLRLPTVAPNP